MLIDRHSGLGRVPCARLELGGGRAVLAGEGQRGVPEVVDRQVRSTGCRAGRSVAVHQVADAHVIGAIAREEESGRAGSGVLEQVLLQQRQERRWDMGITP